MTQILKQRIYLSWPGMDTGVLFELDGTQANVSKADFEKVRRPDDVQITVKGMTPSQPQAST